MNGLTKLSSWSELSNLAREHLSMVELFDTDSDRIDKFSLSAPGLELDYSKNLVNEDIINTLLELARQRMLQERTQALFAGENINISESRPVLHAALRCADDQSSTAPKDKQMLAQFLDTRERIYNFAQAIRDGSYCATENTPIRVVLNIGIGGSDLGARMTCTALRSLIDPMLEIRFVANVDPICLDEVLEGLDPHATLCIVQSKSFSTQETLLNARAVLDWYAKSAISGERHVFAVTANPVKAIDFGIAKSNIFESWENIGGRYGVWGASGLPLAIGIGKEEFSAFLRGAAAMDEHFRAAPPQNNMPLILALLGVWYHNFLGASSYALVPYSERLCLLAEYVQQLDMESNGKSVDNEANTLNYTTGPIVWGDRGTNAQHSFFQFLHQGTRLVPVDFVAARNTNKKSCPRNQALLANMVSQAATLMHGNSGTGVSAHKHAPGNRPSNVLLLDALDPFCLGALIALYEHKIFAQGVIWGVNSYDQWGVERGKLLAHELLEQSDSASRHLDASSLRLLKMLGI
jgi:glucose-6-phosphate isomerase